MSTIDQIVVKIIKEQELIIGPLAWAQAEKVQGLHITDRKSGVVSIDEGNASSVVDRLVNQYERLFGRASVEVCREAVAPFLRDLAPTEVPSSLK